MKHRLLLLLPCLTAWLWLACGQGPLAGGSTSETEAAVYGYIRMPSGDAASGAHVIIRSSAYLVGSTEFTDFNRDTVTDANGFFKVKDMAIGKYVVEITHGDSLGLALTSEIGSKRNPKIDTVLSPLGAVTAFVQTNDTNEYSMEVYGIERQSKVDDNGDLRTPLPVGTFKLQISSDQITQAPLVFSNVEVIPNRDTLLGMVKLPSNANGEIGYWNFEESDSSILDQSPTGLNGKLGGAQRVAGKIGRALSFAHPAVVDLGIPQPDVFDFGAEQDFTMAAWIKIASPLPFNGDSQRILSKQQLSGRAYLLRTLPDGTAAISVRTAMSEANAFDQKGKSVVTDGKWHHIAGRRQQGWLTIFVDGKSEGSRFADSVFRAGDYVPPFSAHYSGNSELKNAAHNRLFIGGHFLGEQTVDGDIDEVHIYRRALTSQELQALANP